MILDGFIGQNEIVNSLKMQIENDKISHANLFIGQRGIGKRTLAKHLANVLLCQNQNACGNCLACTTFEARTSPDLQIIEPDNSKIGIDVIREMQKDVIIKPVYSKYKMYIIVEADVMSVQAQNCLLKTLEEPPEHVVLILTSKNSNSILETILSRAVKFNFKRNSDDEVYEFLSKYYGEYEGKFNFIVKLVDGVIGNAENLIKNEDIFNLRNNVIETVKEIISNNVDKLVKKIEFFDEEKNNIDDIFLILNLLYRDFLVYYKTKNENMLINSDKKDIIINSVSKLNSSKIEKSISIINETREKIKKNANFQLAMEVMLLNLQEESI